MGVRGVSMGGGASGGEQERKGSTKNSPAAVLGTLLFDDNGAARRYSGCVCSGHMRVVECWQKTGGWGIMLLSTPGRLLYVAGKPLTSSISHPSQTPHVSAPGVRECFGDDVQH